MPLSLQDLTGGIDLTVLNPVSAADINSLTNQAIPYVEAGGVQGRGLIITTKDIAVNTPDVPDPLAPGFDKFKKYIWCRLPYPVPLPVNGFTPTLYFWNDDTLSIPIYAKWLPIVADTTSIQNQINVLNNQIAAIQSTAVNATTIANNANTTANTANVTSNNALNQVQAAVTTANAAKTSADANTTDVAALQTQTNILQSQINTVQVTNIPALQSLVKSFAILSENAALGADLGNTAAGQNTRTINTKVNDALNLVTLGAGKITFNVAGTFRIRAIIPFTSNTAGNLNVQSFIKKDSDNSILVQGQSVHIGGGAVLATTLYTEVQGIIAVAANITIRIDMHASAANGTLGLHANDGSANFPNTTSETFTIVEIQQLT